MSRTVSFTSESVRRTRHGSFFGALSRASEWVWRGMLRGRKEEERGGVEFSTRTILLLPPPFRFVSSFRNDAPDACVDETSPVETSAAGSTFTRNRRGTPDPS